MRIFLPLKIWQLQLGLNPQTWVPMCCITKIVHVFSPGGRMSQFYNTTIITPKLKYDCLPQRLRALKNSLLQDNANHGKKKVKS
jgi:hypothetical protein